MMYMMLVISYGKKNSKNKRFFIYNTKTKQNTKHNNKCRFEIDCSNISMPMISFINTQGKPIKKYYLKKLQILFYCSIALSF